MQAVNVYLFEVSVSIGGLYSDDSGSIETQENKPKPAFIAPVDSAVRFTPLTMDEYDEFICYRTPYYRAGNGALVAVEFGVSKRRDMSQAVDDIPVLDGPGKIVPRSVY